jgi:hypothetical protein
MTGSKDVPSFEVYIDTLQNAELHTLDSMPEAVQQMWLESTTDLPLEMLDIKACIRCLIALWHLLIH